MKKVSTSFQIWIALYYIYVYNTTMAPIDDYNTLQTILDALGDPPAPQGGAKADNRYSNEAVNLMLVLLGIKRGCLFDLERFDAFTRRHLEEILQRYGAPYDLLVEGMKGRVEYLVGRPGSGPVFARTIYQKHGLTGRFLGYPVVYEDLATVSRKNTDLYEIRYVHKINFEYKPSPPWPPLGGQADHRGRQSAIIFQFICGRSDFNDVLLDQLMEWRGRMVTTLQEKGIFDPVNDGIELQLILHPQEVVR